MAFSIDKIKAQTNAAFARPNLFRVEFTLPQLLFRTRGITQEKLSINCFQATVPGLSIATTDKDKGFRSVAYQKLYEDITLGFYCSNDYGELEFLQSWMNQIVQAEDSRIGYYSDYIADIDIINLDSLTDGDDRNNQKVLTTKIKEAYPKSISPFTMDYGTVGNILNVTATFTYRYYVQEWHTLDLDAAKSKASLSRQTLGKTTTLVKNKLSQPSTLFDQIVNGSSGAFRIT